MNPVFEPTAILPSQQAPAWDGRTPRGWPRAFQAGGATLAVLALGLSVAAAAGGLVDSHLLSMALVCAMSALAALRSAAWMERRSAVEDGLVDAASGLYNRQGLASAGGGLLQTARREGKPLSLVLLDFSDLPEVRSIYGREISRKLHMRVVRRMKAIAGAQGLAARTGKAQFTILLPGVGRERAQAMVQRLLGKPSRIEFDAGDSEIVLVPDILCETAAADIETVDDLYGEVGHTLAQMRAHELRRQHYLQRERERHSHPMSLPPARQ